MITDATSLQINNKIGKQKALAANLQGALLGCGGDAVQSCRISRDKNKTHAPDVCDKPQVQCSRRRRAAFNISKTKCPQIDEFGLSLERIEKYIQEKQKKKKESNSYKREKLQLK